MSTAVLIHSPDSTLLECFGGVEELFGRLPTEIIGKKPDGLECTFFDVKGKLLPMDQYPLHTVIHDKSPVSGVTLGIVDERAQALVWVEFSGVPKFDKEGNLIKVVTTLELSAEENEVNAQAEQNEISLAELQDWERTFNAMPYVITVLSPDLRVLRANKAAYSTFKTSKNELIGKHCFEVFHGKNEPCMLCPAFQPDLEMERASNLIYNERLDKTFEVTSSPVLDRNGELRYLVHSAKDVTQKLRDEEQRNILSEAVKSTSESVIITDTDGIIQYVNPSYVRNTGYTRDEAQGQHFSFLNINPDSKALFEEIGEKLNKGQRWEGRLTNKRKDNVIFEEYATISPIVNSAGIITHYVVVKRDVTKEEQLQNQLQQAIKMEAIGTLAGGIAHDFNNILSAMIGYGQIAKSRLDGEDPLLNDIEQILQAGDRAANLVKKILAFSRRDTQENFHPLKVQYIVHEVMKLLRSAFPATIEISMDIDNECSPILADSGQIHQVIMNICTNAKQAIGGTYGRLNLTLKEVSISEPQILSGATLLTSGCYINLTVSDSGAGMTDEIKEKIFDPFFTTKSHEEGTGLGLSVVHGIVEKHGGVIVVDSELEVGTTFNLYFPVVKQDVNQEDDSNEPDSLGTERIMVVDDEVVLARVMQRMLVKLGYKVSLFTDSLKAVSEYRRTPNNFDLVITDMTMPNMTGAELARELLSHRPDLPIIMTTGYSEVIDEEKATRIGITKFLLKPVKKKPLAKIIRKVLDDAQDSSN